MPFSVRHVSRRWFLLGLLIFSIFFFLMSDSKGVKALTSWLRFAFFLLCSLPRKMKYREGKKQIISDLFTRLFYQHENNFTYSSENTRMELNARHFSAVIAKIVDLPGKLCDLAFDARHRSKCCSTHESSAQQKIHVKRFMWWLLLLLAANCEFSTFHNISHTHVVTMHQPAQLQMDECECSLHVVFFSPRVNRFHFTLQNAILFCQSIVCWMVYGEFVEFQQKPNVNLVH